MMRQAGRGRSAGIGVARASPSERRQADNFFFDLLGVRPQRRGLALQAPVTEAEWESDAGAGAADAELDSVAEQPAGQIGWCCKRHAIPAVARVEEGHWTSPTGVKLVESAPAQRPFLVKYWMATGQNAATAANSALQSANDHADFPWSAAFICFVMRASGVLQADGFDFGQRHMSYIVGALRNRERSDQNRRFWLVDSVEIKREAIPEPGDLLCFNRPVNNVMTTHSYSSLRTRFWGNNGQHQNVAATGFSHCALVLGTAQQGNQRVLETIGGNETNSVRLKRNVVIDQHGGIPNPLQHNDPGPIFGMIKIMRC
jgi:hypothetical protein